MVDIGTINVVIVLYVVIVLFLLFRLFDFCAVAVPCAPHLTVLGPGHPGPTPEIWAQMSHVLMFTNLEGGPLERPGSTGAGGSIRREPCA